MSDWEGNDHHCGSDDELKKSSSKTCAHSMTKANLLSAKTDQPYAHHLSVVAEVSIKKKRQFKHRNPCQELDFSLVKAWADRAIWCAVV